MCSNTVIRSSPESISLYNILRSDKTWCDRVKNSPENIGVNGVHASRHGSDAERQNEAGARPNLRTTRVRRARSSSLVAVGGKP